MARTISRRATRRIAELKATLTQCKRYTLEGFFVGEDTDPAHAWRQLESSRNARLTDGEDGTFTISVHSNYWYTLSAGASDGKAEGQEP
jgi:hypothetical protein